MSDYNPPDIFEAMIHKAAVNRTLLEAVGVIPAEATEGFDGGVREPANEHPDGPEAARNEAIVELGQAQEGGG